MLTHENLLSLSLDPHAPQGGRARDHQSPGCQRKEIDERGGSLCSGPCPRIPACCGLLGYEQVPYVVLSVCSRCPPESESKLLL